MAEKNTEKRVEEKLKDLIDLIAFDDDLRDEIGLGDIFLGAEARSFEEETILTNNKGIVLTLADGSKFQLTIIGC